MPNSGKTKLFIVSEFVNDDWVPTSWTNGYMYCESPTPLRKEFSETNVPIPLHIKSARKALAFARRLWPNASFMLTNYDWRNK